MLRGLRIEGFRCFDRLDAPRLGRVNLIVGKNNVGKTAFLEAVELFRAPVPHGFIRSPIRRQEWVPAGEPGAYRLAVIHQFNGRRLARGTRISIQPLNAAGDQAPLGHPLTYRLITPRDGEPEFVVLEVGTRAGQLHLHEWNLSADGSWAADVVAEIERTPIRAAIQQSHHSAQFVSGSRIDAGELRRVAALWDSMLLTPSEMMVEDAVRLIQPTLQRIARRGEVTSPGAGFVAAYADRTQPTPFGSEGAGVTHLLALAVHLANARMGTLLVDEVEAGLHYAVLPDIWKLLIGGARALDVQVFATTHSLDCMGALAKAATSLHATADEVLLHRLEREPTEIVTYDLDELKLLVEREIEAR